jgi:hypothetical protein
VSVHVPVAGRPLKATLPVEVKQVGFVIAPITGAVGESGWGFITTSADCAEAQPASDVTIKLKVPAGSPVTVELVPVPVVTTLSGKRVSVQVPEDGKPFSTTLPEPEEQVRCVIVPTTGADGTGFTVRVKVAIAARQGVPSGLFVVTVIVTILPLSDPEGV